MEAKVAIFASHGLAANKSLLSFVQQANSDLFRKEGLSSMGFPESPGFCHDYSLQISP